MGWSFVYSTLVILWALRRVLASPKGAESKEIVFPSQLPWPQEGIGRETCTPRPTSHCAFCMTAM